MVTTVIVPSYFNCTATHVFSQLIVASNGKPSDTEIIFDFSGLSFIDGAGLTIFCNALEWLTSHKVLIKAKNHKDLNRQAISYLDDCGFFRKYIGESLRANASVRSTTLPFQRIAHADAFGWLEGTFTTWMSSKLEVSRGAVGSLRAAIKEIFHNIVDHSTLNAGYIHVQHYPKTRKIGISVADFGKGIPNNVRTSAAELDDAKAILLATEKGFTTKSRPNNMGSGLDFLIANITGNSGEVSIYSYRGVVHCSQLSDLNIKRVSCLGHAAYPGTLIDITLSVDKFVGDDEEERDMLW